MSVDVQVTGIDQAIEKFEQMRGNAGADGGKVADAAAGLILDANRKRFLAEQDPSGKPWIPSLAGLRRREKGDTGTLFASGNLFHSIQLSGGGAGNERFISTGVPYARQHHEGIGQVKREILGVNVDDVRRVTTLVTYLMNKGL